MLPRITCLFLAVAVALWHGHACLACTLGQTAYDENSGLLHRCLNTSGTTEWQENVACWIRPPGTIGVIKVVELEPGQTYRQPDGGRIVAECRSRYRTVALVYHACFNNTAGWWKWPGEVWTGSDGLQYTCTNASLASSSGHYKQGSRVILFACNSTLSGRLVAPGESELHPLDAGIVRKCTFSGTDTRDIHYWMKPVGCWLQYNSQIVQLAFGAEYSVSEYNGQKRVQTVLATCKQRSSNAQALVYNLCKENTTSGETLRQPKSVWTGKDGVQLECLPPNPSELASARIIPRECYENSSTRSFAPGADLRRSDGSIGRCVFSEYKSAYGWFDAVGCWPRDPIWSRVTSLSPSLQVGNEFCPDGKVCLARCEKRRYREEVSLVPKVCFANVGEGVVFRMPNENWTDSSGVSRTCVPMADQASNFGVAAETILRGCAIDKLGKKAAQPGELTYTDDSIVYECAFNSYLRQYSFNRVVGCWMHNQTGRRVMIAGGESYKLPNGQVVASCRRASSNRFVFTVEVCFRNPGASHLKWDNSSIALPGDTVSNGTVRLQCNPAAAHSSYGAHARWIVYGCPSATDGLLVVPGTARNFEDGTVKECAHNQGSGASAAYSWDKTVACWFRDHLGQTIVISQFNVVYSHPAAGNKPTARCQQSSRYSAPKLQLLICFSSTNSRFYTEGDTWTDSTTGLAKQCVGASTYPGDGVVAVDAGCWLQAPSGSNSHLTATQRQLFSSSGSVAYGSENRILRCDFNERARKYEWLTSVACWHLANRTRAVLLMGQEYWSGGLLIFRCLNDTRKGAVLVQYACEQNGSWYGAFSKWNDTNYRYKCEPASGDRSAKVEKTHCLTADGMAIEQSETKGGVKYVCMRICGMLVFMRDPTPLQYRTLFSLINNCHAVNINIINNIG